jgi:anthranilate phosphoribosyltransferase
MGTSILHETVRDFDRRLDLHPERMESTFEALLNETDSALLSCLFTSWNNKGFTASEISGLAEIMRSRMTKIRSRHAACVDSVGTGGSRAKTFNVSTAAAFVIAGAGVPVAKHGNRAATSKTGSTDALSELGIDADIDPAESERHLNVAGICFMFAPRFHRLSPLLAQVRRELRFPTVFNCLGPLCNPASTPHQLIGVWSRDLVVKMAEAVARLGTSKSWVVHGEDGLDEITVRGRTFVAEIEGSSVRYFDLSPKDFGIDNGHGSVPTAATPAESALIIQKVLDGELRDSAAEKLVLLNASAAIYISGFANSLQTALEMARWSLTEGRAAEKLEMLTKRSGRELR